MNVSEITIYEALKTKFSAKEAETIVGSLKETIKEQLASEREVFATKEDMLKMKVEIIKWVVGLFIVQAAMIIGLYLKK